MRAHLEHAQDGRQLKGDARRDSVPQNEAEQDGDCADDHQVAGRVGGRESVHERPSLVDGRRRLRRRQVLSPVRLDVVVDAGDRSLGGDVRRRGRRPADVERQRIEDDADDDDGEQRVDGERQRVRLSLGDGAQLSARQRLQRPVERRADGHRRQRVYGAQHRRSVTVRVAVPTQPPSHRDDDREQRRRRQREARPHVGGATVGVGERRHRLRVRGRLARPLLLAASAEVRRQADGDGEADRGADDDGPMFRGAPRRSINPNAHPRLKEEADHRVLVHHVTVREERQRVRAHREHAERPRHVGARSFDERRAVRWRQRPGDERRQNGDGAEPEREKRDETRRGQLQRAQRRDVQRAARRRTQHGVRRRRRRRRRVLRVADQQPGGRAERQRDHRDARQHRVLVELRPDLAAHVARPAQVAREVADQPLQPPLQLSVVVATAARRRRRRLDGQAVELGARPVVQALRVGELGVRKLVGQLAVGGEVAVHLRRIRGERARGVEQAMDRVALRRRRRVVQRRRRVGRPVKQVEHHRSEIRERNRTSEQKGNRRDEIYLRHVLKRLLKW